MNINRILKSYGVIFPKDVTKDHVRYLINCGSIPIFKYYSQRKEIYTIDYGKDLSILIYYKFCKILPLNTKDIKILFALTKKILNVYPFGAWSGQLLEIMISQWDTYQRNKHECK